MDLTSDIRRIIDYFKLRDEIAALYIFGSAVNGRATDESDIDIAVLIKDHKIGPGACNALRKAYYVASPGLSSRPMDIVILNTAPPFLKHRIIKTGRLLFGRNKKLRSAFTAKTIIEYLDYKPIEDVCLRAVADRFRKTAVG